MNFFLKGSKSKIKKNKIYLGRLEGGGGKGGGARVREFFFYKESK